MNNIKDTVTTICGWIIALGGAVLAAAIAGTLTVPEAVVGALTFIVGLATAILGMFSGRNADGSKKKNPTNV